MKHQTNTGMKKTGPKKIWIGEFPPEEIFHPPAFCACIWQWNYGHCVWNNRVHEQAWKPACNWKELRLGKDAQRHLLALKIRWTDSLHGVELQLHFHPHIVLIFTKYWASEKILLFGSLWCGRQMFVKAWNRCLAEESCPLVTGLEHQIHYEFVSVCSPWSMGKRRGTYLLQMTPAQKWKMEHHSDSGVSLWPEDWNEVFSSYRLSPITSDCKDSQMNCRFKKILASRVYAKAHRCEKLRTRWEINAWRLS